MSIEEVRVQAAIAAMQGMLAAETEDYGECAVYLDPEGKETFRNASYPKDGQGNHKYGEPLIEHKLLRSREQEIAHKAVLLAEALTIELIKVRA